MDLSRTEPTRVLERALALVWDKRTRDAAAREAAAAGEVVSLATRHAIRAKAIRRFFADEDPRGDLNRQSLVVRAPLETFLNAAFAAEATACELFTLMTSRAAPDEEAVAAANAFRNIAKHISRERGLEAVRAYCESITIFASDAWQGFSFSAEVQSSCAVKMIVVMCSCWRRLVFKTISDTRHALLAVRESGSAPITSDAPLEAECERRQGEARRCQSCVDPEITTQLLARMSDAPDRTRKFLVELLTVLRVSSSVVERCHINAQEAKASGSRGKALFPSSLARETYEAGVVEEDGKKKDQQECEGCGFAKASAFCAGLQ